MIDLLADPCDALAIEDMVLAEELETEPLIEDPAAVAAVLLAVDSDL